jgi:hypothetical protein
MKSSDIVIKVIAMSTALLLWAMGVMYLFISIVRVYKNGINTEGSPRELVIGLLMAFLYGCGGLVAKRSMTNFSYKTDSLPVVIFTALIFATLWAAAGLLLFLPQMVVY